MYFDFHPDNLLSNRSTTGSQMDLSLNFAPRGRPRWEDGRESIEQPRTPASESILSTCPTGEIELFDKLTRSPDTASN